MNEPMMFDMESLIEGMEEKDSMVGDPREKDEKIFYILTNRERSHAAFYVLLPEMQEKLYERFGSYYVLPSSIHETLIVPKKKLSMSCTVTWKKSQVC